MREQHEVRVVVASAVELAGYDLGHSQPSP
jgi:hypothetical protein